MFLRVLKVCFKLGAVAMVVVALGMVVLVAFWSYAGSADLPMRRVEHAISGAVLAVTVVGGPPYIMFLMRGDTFKEPHMHE